MIKYFRILNEYGAKWLINRFAYSLKLKFLRIFQKADIIFEKNVKIKNIDIFEQINVKNIEKFLLNNLSINSQTEIINNANEAIEGKILAFSSIKLDYGSPINWHLHPITNETENNKTKWFNIPDFDPIRGDIKVIWEASRFSHFYLFSRAYMITKNRKYYEAFSEQLADWLNNNKYPYGAHFKDGQENSLRMINTLITYSIFRYYNMTTKADEINVMTMVDYCYRKILSNFFYAKNCIKNNHTISEIVGRIIGGYCSNNYEEVKYAYSMLNDVIKEQFFDDGGYKQFSFNYQRFALQLIELVNLISIKVNSFEIDQSSIELIRKSIYQLFQFQNSQGYLPNYGSNDGALIFPVSSSDYRNYKPIINTLCYIINNYLPYEEGEHDEELFWFTSIDYHDYIHVKRKTIDRKSSVFEDSGLFSLRNNNINLMIILQNFTSRPAHLDQLHVDLWFKSRNILCDNGSYSYADIIGQELIETGSHNTIKVSDLEQMERKPPFFIYNWSSRIINNYSKTCFDGTMISKNNYQHRRKVKITNNSVYIKDIVTTKEEYITINFFTPCDVELNSNIVLLKDNDEIIGVMEFEQKVFVEQSYRSLYYYKKEKINKLSVKIIVENNESSHLTQINFL